MSYVVTDVSEKPQIFTAVPASNTKHEPTQNSPDNFHGKNGMPQTAKLETIKLEEVNGI